MAGSDRYITVKVLVSYLFLLFIAVFSVTYIYNLIEKTDLIEQSDALPRQKSYLVNQTLSLIYESEAIGQLLDQAPNMGHYNRTLKQAKQNLDSLRSLTTDSVQQLKIDTIGQLLDQKRWYTKQLMETWKESLTERIYITNIERLIEIPDTVVNEVVIQKHIEVQQDTVVVPRKRLGFFKRLAEVFVPTKQDTSIIINTTEHVVMDTLVRSYNPADTIVSVLRSLQDSVIEQRGQLINELQERARNLRYNNSLLTNRINLLLRDIEKEELEISMNQMLKRQDLLRETSQLIARIAVGSVVVVLLFSLLIGHDLSRSRFYRQQLERAKRHAEQLSEGRERLMLAISHDIRAPLSSIMGYIELLLRRHPDDRQRYFLENMQSSSEHILSLVNDLLDDQRLAAGEMEVHAIPFRLATLFQEIHTSFKPLADARGLRFVLNLKEEKLCDRVYLSDPIRIRQMVGNLLSNAFKFTQEGRVVVLVSLREQDAQQYELAVSVSDTGCGIAKADQA
ncbi:MAG: ATP-binding protein, partial [Parabacteroides sp.]|nr:ATP-binding protein [Parabacteroides sp.]